MDEHTEGMILTENWRKITPGSHPTANALEESFQQIPGE